MPDAKTRICEAATRLFNERGYDAVTMRDIAQEAGTSLGNLTYHFSRKEKLLDELLSSLHSSFSSQLDVGAVGEDLLGHLLDTFDAAEANERDYPFYFRNVPEIYRSSEAVRHDTDEFAEGLFSHYAACLKRLRKDGLVRSDLDDREVEHVARLMVHTESSWMLPSSAAENPLMDRVPVSDALAALLELCLTEAGRGVLKDLAQGRASRAERG